CSSRRDGSRTRSSASRPPSRPRARARTGATCASAGMAWSSSTTTRATRARRSRRRARCSRSAPSSRRSCASRRSATRRTRPGATSRARAAAARSTRSAAAPRSSATAAASRVLVIELDRFSKRYGDRAAVEDLSFAVAPGDILGLVGPNGAGKTTTLRAIAGVLRPGGGTIRVDGFDVVKEPTQAKRRLALVPDTPNPYELLTVREHLEFARLAYGVARDGRDPDELLAKFELTDKRDELCGSLSRGMRQKLAICCALLHRPKALLLDEPPTRPDP